MHPLSHKCKTTNVMYVCILMLPVYPVLMSFLIDLPAVLKASGCFAGHRIFNDSSRKSVDLLCSKLLRFVTLVDHAVGARSTRSGGQYMQ